MFLHNYKDSARVVWPGLIMSDKNKSFPYGEMKRNSASILLLTLFIASCSKIGGGGAAGAGLGVSPDVSSSPNSNPNSAPDSAPVEIPAAPSAGSLPVVVVPPPVVVTAPVAAPVAEVPAAPVAEVPAVPVAEVPASTNKDIDSILVIPENSQIAQNPSSRALQDLP